MRDVCFNCQHRFLGCHSSCKDYIDAKTEHLEEQAEIRKRKNIDWDFSNYVKESIAKGKRKHAIR